jgi:hypothetical protein
MDTYKPFDLVSSLIFCGLFLFSFPLSSLFVADAFPKVYQISTAKNLKMLKNILKKVAFKDWSSTVFNIKIPLKYNYYYNYNHHHQSIYVVCSGLQCNLLNHVVNIQYANVHFNQPVFGKISLLHKYWRQAYLDDNYSSILKWKMIKSNAQSDIIYKRRRLFWIWIWKQMILD